jgi:hypothetical protein
MVGLDTHLGEDNDGAREPVSGAVLCEIEAGRSQQRSNDAAAVTATGARYSWLALEEL